MAEELKAVNSSSDPELVSAAQSLLELIPRRSPCPLQPEGMMKSPRCFHRGGTTKTGVFVRPRPIVRPLRRLTNYS
jgi:hypothetical protein